MGFLLTWAAQPGASSTRAARSAPFVTLKAVALKASEVVFASVKRTHKPPAEYAGEEHAPAAAPRVSWTQEALAYDAESTAPT